MINRAKISISEGKRKDNLMKEENKLTSSRLAESLADNNLRPVDIYEKTGISQSALSLYLSGARIPNRDNAEKLGKVLCVNPVWLMGFDVPKYLDTPEKEKELLLTYFAQLPPDKQEVVLNLIKTMV